MLEYSRDDNIRICKGDDYNWKFDTVSGNFMRWGKTEDDDPDRAPAPEILDIEISTVCHQGCPMCYKSNTCEGKYMSLEDFKKMFAKFDKNLTQIAFGIGDIDGNPDLYPIMQHCRDNGVIPNITINGSRMTDDDYKQLAKLCGAVAVSHYDDDTCYNAVYKLHEAGCRQVNIHQVLSNETLDDCIKLMKDIKNMYRLNYLNAVVFLWLKPKGDRNTLTPIIDRKKYNEFVELLLKTQFPFGFDSCSANNFLQTIAQVAPELYDVIEPSVEPCESSLFSYYINVDGVAYPCSFSEGMVQGIPVADVESFSEIWNDKYTNIFRDMLCDMNRSCPIYDLRMND